MSSRSAVAKALADADLPNFVAPPEGLGPEQAAGFVDAVNVTLARANHYVIGLTLENRALRAQVRALRGVPETPFTILTEVREGPPSQ